MIPWHSFDSFQLNFQNVWDGLHVCRFLEELQTELQTFSESKQALGTSLQLILQKLHTILLVIRIFFNKSLSFFHKKTGLSTETVRFFT